AGGWLPSSQETDRGVKKHCAGPPDRSLSSSFDCLALCRHCSPSSRGSESAPSARA
ncbi:hypothetical protein BaRGS_00001188, partial [Batillaria attramentaria]